MHDRGALSLGLRRTLVLAVAGIAAVAAVVAVAPTTSAQAPAGQLGGPRGVGGTQSAKEYRVQSVTFTGFKSVPEDVLRKTLGLTVGEVYSDENLRKGFEGLKQVYGDSGYIGFVPEPTFDFNEDRKLVTLTIHIKEGAQFTVNRIRFTGNTTTPDDVLRREILVKEGAIYNGSLWNLSLQRLNQLGLFEEIKTEDVWIWLSFPTEGKFDIELRLQEKGR